MAGIDTFHALIRSLFGETVFGLVGGNDSGKTTTLDALSFFTTPMQSAAYARENRELDARGRPTRGERDALVLRSHMSQPASTADVARRLAAATRDTAAAELGSSRRAREASVAPFRAACGQAAFPASRLPTPQCVTRAPPCPAREVIRNAPATDDDVKPIRACRRLYGGYGTPQGAAISTSDTFLMVTGNEMGVTTQEGALYLYSERFERLETFMTEGEITDEIVQYFDVLARCGSVAALLTVSCEAATQEQPPDTTKHAAYAAGARGPSRRARQVQRHCLTPIESL